MGNSSDRSQLLFQKLERQLLKLASKPGPENVHRFRTQARRLQAMLETMPDKLDRNQQKLLKLLGRIRKRAGRVRDLDVQLTALRSLKFPQEPRRKAQLVEHLIDMRKPYEKRMHRAAAATVREIRRRLRRAAKSFRISQKSDPFAVARKMLQQVAQADAPPTEDLLHRYRLWGKRARYTAELAPKSAESAQFIAELKRLQDALGDWHDWFTLTTSARDLLGDVRESPLVAELQNVTGAKFRHAVAVLAQVKTKLGLSAPVSSPHSPARSGNRKAAASAA